MKNLLILIIVAVLASCSKPDLKTQITNLHTKRTALDKEIELLEKELALTDTSSKIIKRKIIRVDLKEAVPTVFEHFIEVQGKLDGEENIAMNPAGPMGQGGLIKAVYVKTGDVVKKDQVIAMLDDAVLQQQLNTAKNSLSFVTTLYDKQKALWDQKIGSEVQYLSAKNQKETLENQIKTLQEQIDLCKVKSPISGTIEEVNAKVGQITNPMLPLPAFRIVNFNNIKVMADIAEAYAQKVRKGDEVMVLFPDLNKEVKTKISFAADYINPVNRTFGVETRFPSNGLQLKANMVCVVKINDYQSNKALVLPVNVIQSNNDGKYVFIATQQGEKTIVNKSKITEGLTYNGMTEILSGIPVNAKIVIAGFQELEDGFEVISK